MEVFQFTKADIKNTGAICSPEEQPAWDFSLQLGYDLANDPDYQSAVIRRIEKTRSQNWPDGHEFDETDQILANKFGERIGGASDVIYAADSAILSKLNKQSH